LEFANSQDYKYIQALDTAVHCCQCHSTSMQRLKWLKSWKE